MMSHLKHYGPRWKSFSPTKTKINNAQLRSSLPASSLVSPSLTWAKSKYIMNDCRLEALADQCPSGILEVVLPSYQSHLQPEEQ